MIRRLAVIVCLLCSAAAVVVAADGDVTSTRDGGGTDPAPAVFPHWSHRIRFRCYACHDQVFPMARNATRVTMDDIAAGKACGTCHNGRRAWAVTFETCNRCHPAR